MMPATSSINNVIWEMPFFNNASNRVARALMGGWQLSGTVQFQTGAPFTIGNGDDYLGIGSTNFKPWNLSGEPNRPQEFANRNAAGNFNGVTTQSFETTVGGSAYATRPANGTIPNQNRNSISFNNVGFQNWDASAFKSFKITERQFVQFRTEFFNLPNHPNWGGVDGNPTSATLARSPARAVTATSSSACATASNQKPTQQPQTGRPSGRPVCYFPAQKSQRLHAHLRRRQRPIRQRFPYIPRQISHMIRVELRPGRRPAAAFHEICG